jgi:D-3-phosphoglycerate dehydrogenase
MDRLRALVVGDSWLPVAPMVEHLTRDLDPIQLDLVTHEMHGPMVGMGETVVPGSGRVIEYVGDPQELLDLMSGVNVLFVHGAPVTREVLLAGGDLIAIGVARSDPVSVDVEAATKLGLPVFNAKGRSAQPVADLTIGLMLAVGRRMVSSDAFVRQGLWESLTLDPATDAIQLVTTRFRGSRLAGSTVGIIGFGKIGRLVARRLTGWDVDLFVYDPYVDQEAMGDARKVDLDTLLRTCKFITLHVPPSNETKGLIGARELALMRPDACLINCSRGSVVDQAALCAALRDNQIFGAGLDVYEEEPLPSSSPLLKLENVVLTPHLGGVVLGFPEIGSSLVTRNLGRFLRRESFENLLNPEYAEYAREGR